MGRRYLRVGASRIRLGDILEDGVSKFATKLGTVRPVEGGFSGLYGCMICEAKL